MHCGFRLMNEIRVVLIELCGFVLQLAVLTALLTVFYPQQGKRDTALLHLPVDMLVIRHLVGYYARLCRKQLKGYFLLRHSADLFPRQPILLCPCQRTRHGIPTACAGGCNIRVCESQAFEP